MQTVEALAVALTGTAQTESEPVRLAAGPLTVEFDGGGLRYVCYGEVEVIRAISFLARDENWGTHALKLDDVQIEQRDDAFEVRFRGACGPGGTELQLSASIVGNARGQFEFNANATLAGDLLTNRTGFVVLHPLEVSGKPVVVETVDGQRQSTRFPEKIDPFQPFRDIRALTTQHSDALSVEVRMEGDTFEMEDQRNWSDASFKTYVRPLALPWPYTLAKGSTLAQSVKVTVQAARPVAASRASGTAAAPARVRLDAFARAQGAVPQLGIGVRAGDLDTALQHADALLALNPAYFIAHLDLRRDDPAEAVARFAQLADTARVPYVLEIVLTGDGDPADEMRRVAAAASGRAAPVALQVSPAPDLKAVLPGSPWPPCPSFDDVFAAARAAFPTTPLGGGTFAYFTELNRKRPPFDKLDYATFTTCPIVHAADDRSVMETLATLPFIANSVAALAGKTPYRVGPGTIAARDNPYGAATLPNESGPRAKRICLTDNDPRQRALFGAAWNLGYFAAFAAGGATHIALSELTGPRGLFDSGKPTPLFRVLASLAQARGAQMANLEVEPGRVPLAAFAAQRAAATTLWIANLSAQANPVELDIGGTDKRAPNGATVARWLPGVDFADAPPPHAPLTAGTLKLEPYETAEIRLLASTS
ncbi:D-apionate lactonase [Paraburkholderia sp. 2C]